MASDPFLANTNCGKAVEDAIDELSATYQVWVCGGTSGIRQNFPFRNYRNLGIIVFEPFIWMIRPVPRVEEIVTPRWRLSPMSKHPIVGNSREVVTPQHDLAELWEAMFHGFPNWADLATS